MENNQVTLTRQRNNNNIQEDNWTGTSMSLNQLMQMQNCGLDVNSNESGTKAVFICGKIQGPISENALNKINEGYNKQEDVHLYQVSEYYNTKEEDIKKYGKTSYCLVLKGASKTIASFRL